MKRRPMKPVKHQYLERHTGRVLTEQLHGDKVVNLLYCASREQPGRLFRALTGARVSDLLAFFNFDSLIGAALTGSGGFLRRSGIDFNECLTPIETMTTMRDVFERKIRYWECRPMPEHPGAVLAPADSRMIMGSFLETSSLFLKGKFFNYPELLGAHRTKWLKEFKHGDFAIFRLTPDKYHYNHTPVAGKVADIYEIPGIYHSCNPAAVVSAATPYSKNKRVVTVLDTDVSGGSGVGLVAMLEVVALMIGDVVQCYSEKRYDTPQPLQPGMFLERGCPKSLYRPGSSTDVLLFQKGRIRFAEDLIVNMYNSGVESRFSLGFGRPLAETEVRVRSFIGSAMP